MRSIGGGEKGDDFIFPTTNVASEAKERSSSAGKVLPSTEVEILVFGEWEKWKITKGRKFQIHSKRRAQYNDNEIMNFHQHSNQIKSDLRCLLLAAPDESLVQQTDCLWKAIVQLSIFATFVRALNTETLAQRNVDSYGWNHWLMDAVRCSFNYHSAAQRDESEHQQDSRFEWCLNICPRANTCFARYTNFLSLARFTLRLLQNQ